MPFPPRRPSERTVNADRGIPLLGEDETLVELRCSLAVIHSDAFLLLHRESRDDWVLPGGRPRASETMSACAGREAREETGLDIRPARCAFVLEVIDPDAERRVVELVFLGTATDPDGELVGEPGTTPQWLPAARLRDIRLRPPIAGYLPVLIRGTRATAPYLGNLWRPSESARQPTAQDKR